MLTVVQENGSKKAWDECRGDWLHMIKILQLKTIALQIDQLDPKKGICQQQQQKQCDSKN